MSLINALEIARSALTASQVGLQVSGNNMANAATPGYSRQVVLYKGIPGAQADVFRVGRGVGVASVQRKVDEALQRRLWSGISDEFSAAKRTSIFDQLEGIFNELTGYDLSTELGSFFNTWSEVSSVLDSGTVVIQQGSKMAAFIRSMRGDMENLRSQVENELDANVTRANDLLGDIANLNRTITQAEVGGNQASTLRDQRDQLIGELSTLIDVHAVEDAQGNLDVLVGSTPVILAGESRGLDIERVADGDNLEIRIVVGADREPLPATSGTIGGLLEARDGTIDQAIADLDQLSAQIIFQVNKLHSTGTDGDGLLFADSDLQVPTADRTLAFNDPNNETFSDLPFHAENGGFYVNVTNSATGSTDQVWIDVDLDGLTNAGLAGYDDDTTPEDIRAALDAIDGITATWSPDGRLTVEADTGYSFSFQDDSSSVLGVMGVNAFFTGTSGQDIAVRQSLLDDPQNLMLGRIVDGQFVENGTALQIAGLQDSKLEDLGDRSVLRFWTDRVQGVATKASTAASDAEAAKLVRESLETQNAAVSGVSLDEESVNLLTYQRQFQGAAQLVNIANEMFNTLLSIL
ncbi:MAG: flagellar hook-associated protein FlgK [Phycisphaerales bacterium]